MSYNPEKPKCERCGSTEHARWVIEQGPDGYRRYRQCNACFRDEMIALGLWDASAPLFDPDRIPGS